MPNEKDEKSTPGIQRIRETHETARTSLRRWQCHNGVTSHPRAHRHAPAMLAHAMHELQLSAAAASRNVSDIFGHLQDERSRCREQHDIKRPLRPHPTTRKHKHPSTANTHHAPESSDDVDSWQQIAFSSGPRRAGTAATLRATTTPTTRADRRRAQMATTVPAAGMPPLRPATPQRRGCNLAPALQSELRHIARAPRRRVGPERKLWAAGTAEAVTTTERPRLVAAREQRPVEPAPRARVRRRRSATTLTGAASARERSRGSQEDPVDKLN